MTSINKYKIIKKLDTGSYRTIYLVQKNNKKYAMKIEKIPKEYLAMDLSSPIRREVYFSKHLAEKYPQLFSVYIESDIIKNCSHVHKYYYSDMMSLSAKKFYKDLKESIYCSRKIMTLVDTTLDKIINKLDRKQMYSIFIQTVMAIKIMHTNGYVQADFHSGNIGINKTSKKYIVVDNKKLPLFGYQVQLIDYGAILNKKFKLINHPLFGSEKKVFKFTYDKIINRLISIWGFYNNYYKDVSVEKLDWNNITKKQNDSTEMTTLEKMVGIPNKSLMFELLFPKKNLETLINKKNKKSYFQKNRFNSEDILMTLFFLEKNTKDKYDVIIDYFILRINEMK